MSWGSSHGDRWEPLFESFASLKRNWLTRGWSWDSRFSCVTSSFSADFEAKARALAAEALNVEWTPKTIQTAPRYLRDVADRTGGMRPGQLLLSTSPYGTLIGYGLWWPWGDGITISLRIGLSDVDGGREPITRLRDAFGVSM